MEVNILHELYEESNNKGGILEDKIIPEEAFAEEKKHDYMAMVTTVDPKALKMPDMNANDYLTKQDIMKMLHIQSDKALKLLKSTMLDSIKLGKQYLTRRCWLEDFFEKYKNQEIEL